jgi:hypothetical protein
LYIEYSNHPRINDLNEPAFAKKQLTQALYYLGLLAHHTYTDQVASPVVKQQQFAKINEVPKDVRQKFILWASERGVYSLGRFATWRPGLLLDDIVNDVRVIRRLIKGDHTPIYQEKVK